MTKFALVKYFRHMFNMNSVRVQDVKDKNINFSVEFNLIYNFTPT